jgi:hypothetical protein
MRESCSTCRFWGQLQTGGGSCRRMPPQVVGGDDGVSEVSFPCTNDDEWCGEWRSDLPSLPASAEAEFDQMRRNFERLHGLMPRTSEAQ